MNEIMSFAGKWMDLEITMLSKVSQVQKDNDLVFSHMWKINPKDKLIYNDKHDNMYACVCVYMYMQKEREHVFNTETV
jgi:hypothetical protein